MSDGNAGICDTQDAVGTTNKNLRKVALTALGGTSIEWYDFYLYGTAAALVFPTAFFSSDMPVLIALLASFSTFAVGFIARPIGGIVFGHFGDKAGRKKALIVAMLLMGGATTLIGCLPTYEQVGPVATLLLIALRFAQGFAIGGQWAGAVLLVTESAPVEQRGFYGSFAQMGAPFGVVLANLAFLLATATLSAEAFMSWGWRVPFLASVALILLSLYAQRAVEETSAFRELQKEQPTIAAKAGATIRKSPILEVIRSNGRRILLAAGAFIAVQVTFFILVAFLTAYGTSPEGLGLPKETMLLALLISAVVMIPALLAAAAWSDRHGRKGIYITGAVLLGFWGFAMFPLLDTRSLPAIIVAISVGQILVAMMYGPQAAFLAELFGARLRYSGASLAYQLGAIAGGALAPLIATGILSRYGSSLGISVYIALACLVTIVCTACLPETNPRRPV